jgi:hypothetical protein
LFLFIALIFFSPCRRAPVATRPSPTTSSAQHRVSEMAPCAPEAAHSPQYDVCRRCSSTGHAASTPPVASLLLHPQPPLPRPPPLLLRRHEQTTGSHQKEPDLARCLALPNRLHATRPASPPAIRREERH